MLSADQASIRTDSTNTVGRKATLIVLAWNSWSLTKHTLDTLAATDLTDSEVIVVDNGSTDETADCLASYGSWVRVVRLPENVGFVRGNNAGIAQADAQSDIVLLNNDLSFEQADWLQRLRGCAYIRHDTGIVGCRLIQRDRQLVHAGTFILPDTCWGQQSEGGLEQDIGQFTRDRPVQGIVFAVAYIKRAVINAIGGLDLAFQSYFEDTDYCLRAKQAGFSTVLCGGVTVMHLQHGSTPGHDDQRERLFKAGQEVFTARWKKILDLAYERDVLWQSIINFPGGYAMSSRALLRGLDEAGIRVAYEYVYGPGTPHPVSEPENSGNYRLNVIASRRLAAPPISVVYGQGDVLHRARGALKVGFTMLEVDGFPAEWVRQANQMDEVWVPSTFNRNGFLYSGLKRPIEVTPLGFDPDYFHPQVAGSRNPYGEYVFLASFEWSERKDPWLLLETFSRTFRAKEPVRLLVKINNRDPRVDIAAEIRGLQLSATGGRISYLINRTFPYYQLGALYRSADCFVSAGRGEGWDMPLIEAMACGLPSIATDWGAHSDFVHPGIAYPLAIKGTIAARARCPYYLGHRWAEPDGDHLAHLLRHIYEHPQEAVRIGAAAVRELRAKWTWDHAVDRIKKRLMALS